ncbi:ABC transporter family substrate-binding protein [Kutzneria kofuensis]|uniref:Peptide/nickel transport system substrate-binding protein n=1 Tax=Kutzneria kofuensis TaxID=103725 RepID=A0A7W9NGG4_9PSEU|nr:ABC transporter family substrate-binding protein [Kutzneria kofuensis]MBB5891504.1 peptide/nickel transport system substrate-binding protein [Kutzneria kofuensis]
MNRKLLGALAVAALLVTACGGGNSGGNGLKPNESITGKNDINAQPADKIKQGGILQWPIDQLSDNWNPAQTDGSTQTGTWMINAMLPWLFTAQQDNTLALNKDYLTSADLVSSSPEVVEYKISPKAKWSNGRAISWEDFQSNWQACNGKKSDYQCNSTTGLENIEKVERGSDDQDVKVTFAKPFGEWQSLFSPLTPKELNATADEFNKGWEDEPKITAGPFKVGKIDLTAKTVSLVPDPNWWGAKPHLDQILFKVVSRNALPDALASGAVDFYRIGSSVDLYQRAKTISGVTIRQSTESQYNLLDFNGADGTPLHDQATRVAVEQAVDTKSIAKALLGPMSSDPTPLGNHFFVKGTKYYKDNSAPIKFDPEAAKKKLDELGYKQSGDFRAKDGKELDLNFVIDSGNPISTAISGLVQAQLKTVGINAKINSVPAAELFKNYVRRGAFDLVAYGLSAPPQPISANAPTFYYTPGNNQSNYAAIGNDTINKLLDQAGSELDENKRIDLIQQADTEIWKEGHILPTYQVPGAYAVRNTLANFGAFGFAQYPFDYVDMGFLK